MPLPSPSLSLLFAPSPSRRDLPKRTGEPRVSPPRRRPSPRPHPPAAASAAVPTGSPPAAAPPGMAEPGAPALGRGQPAGPRATGTRPWQPCHRRSPSRRGGLAKPQLRLSRGGSLGAFARWIWCFRPRRALHSTPADSLPLALQTLSQELPPTSALGTTIQIPSRYCTTMPNPGGSKFRCLPYR